MLMLRYLCHIFMPLKKPSFQQQKQRQQHIRIYGKHIKIGIVPFNPPHVMCLFT